jgi:ABC-type branched-subunit amino acid transport system ATPase component
VSKKHELGLAILWIEHDMQIIFDLADGIHVLDYGARVSAGSLRRCWPFRR